jgi:8-oxo-dGTP pyrophosphatase MutT (NUDIX family)
MGAGDAGEQPRERVASRVLVVDEAGRVLLFRGSDPAVPGVWYWFTPGGGLDEGESFAEAAVRELAEETGLPLKPEQLGDPVHEEVTSFSFNGVSYRQEQRFFLVRSERFAVSTAGFDAYEVASIDRHHWWSVPELERASEAYYPADLIAILKRLGVPSC